MLIVFSSTSRYFQRGGSSKSDNFSLSYNISAILANCILYMCTQFSLRYIMTREQLFRKFDLMLRSKSWILYFFLLFRNICDICINSSKHVHQISVNNKTLELPTRNDHTKTGVDQGVSPSHNRILTNYRSITRKRNTRLVNDVCDR